MYANLNRIQGVSLPRSGHNMLVRHLQQYFGSTECCSVRPTKWPFTRPKSAVEKAEQQQGATAQLKNFQYCEFYYSCRKAPCVSRHNTFQKSHDFELDLETGICTGYIIQTRSEVNLLISWFEMRLAKGREADTPDGFAAFAQRQRPYLQAFIDKWIEADLPNRLVLEYEDYLAEPEKCLAQAIRMFDPTSALDRERIAKIAADVRPARDNRNFRFHEVAASLQA